MDCQVCRTQLLSEAWACPNCGTPTPAYYAPSGASAYDPTIPAMSGSSLAVMSAPPPPPTQYGANPYANSVQSPYPVTPYGTPPPPPSRRPGKRIGIIVGIVLLVLLLIGGGVFAWLRFSAARATFTANGTFTISNTTTTSTQQAGQNTLYSLTQQGVNDGDLSGSFTDEETSTSHPDNTSIFSGRVTCTCTVASKSGTLMYSITGSSAADGSFTGQIFNFQGTGDLANLHGQGTFQGQGSNGIYHGTYSDQLHFDG
jgi:hypothetical protein